jgi:uncharacterized membrane protein
MRKILSLTMKGLVTVLPLALTMYVVIWFVQAVESWLRRGLIGLRIVDAEHYWPGLGLVAGFILALTIGLIVNAYAGRLFLDYWDGILNRIPVIKTLYGGFRDVVSFLPSGGGQKSDLQRVVLARFGEARAIGFVTREEVPAVLHAHGGKDWVSVFFPYSFGMGGYTLYLSRDRLEALDMPVQEALRLVLTGGLTSSASRDGRSSSASS